MSNNLHDPYVAPGATGSTSTCPPPVLLLRVDDVGVQLALSRATVNRLLAAGVLPSVKLGRSRRVLYRALEVFVDDLAAGRLSVEAQRLLQEAG